MHQDVIDIRDFYLSPLGRVARRMIRRAVRQFWPDVTDLNVLGLGYATPFLEPLRGEAQRTISLMPAQQGVMQWPQDAPNLNALVDETELPLPEVSIDRVLLVHAIETGDDVQPMLRAIWRVLAGGGRLLAVVPNRRGMWAPFERTPFGIGQPYSPAQLAKLLRDNMFAPIRSSGVLFVPPTNSRMVLSAAMGFEEIGQRWFNHFAGAVIIEASKQIYAGTPVRERKGKRVLVPNHAPTALPRSRIVGEDAR
jgi:SAM-dependent methyltransferase